MAAAVGHRLQAARRESVRVEAKGRRNRECVGWRPEFAGLERRLISGRRCDVDTVSYRMAWAKSAIRSET